jgi:glycosyltransferase involved in cell wall biosynthesis
MPSKASNSALEPSSIEVEVVPRVSAIVPARNEEAVISGCIESLASQPEIAEIIVVNDQSIDKTAEVVGELLRKIPRLRLIEANGIPAGWVGKNHAVALGAKEATHPWLLFTDADAVHELDAAARALYIAQKTGAALVSFSPEQHTKTWYEKALIPFIYCRLTKLFSYDDVNNPNSPAAAANGQFLMIRRDAYEAVGGHASVAGEILEDVALAKLVKSAGYKLWFASGKGIVRVRMYRSFSAMWEGWRKNLYRLVGGTPWKAFRELENAFPWIPIVLVFVGLKFPLAMFVAALFLIMRQMNYGSELARNQYPFSLILYYVPGVTLYAGVLWASYRSHAKGKVEWKGREYPVEAAGGLK